MYGGWVVTRTSTRPSTALPSRPPARCTRARQGGLERPGRGRGEPGEVGVHVARRTRPSTRTPGRGLCSRGAAGSCAASTPNSGGSSPGGSEARRRRRRRRSGSPTSAAPPRPGSGRRPRRGPAGPCRSRRSRTGCGPGRRRRSGSGRARVASEDRAEVAERKRAGVRRTNHPQVPGASAGRSSPNSSVPVTLASPSVRAMRAPTASPTAGDGAARPAPSVERTAWTIEVYPVHRQSTPPRPSSTSAAVGLGFRAMRSSAAISIPGVQAPHWAPPQRGTRPGAATRRGAGETLDRLDAPPVDLAGRDRQAQTCSPSSRTVHAPQSPALQPTLVPVRPRSSRRTSTSRRRPSIRDLEATPLTWNRSRGSRRLGRITPRPRRSRAGPASGRRPGGSPADPRTSSIGESWERCSIAGTVARPARRAARGARARGRAAAGRPGSTPRPRSARRRHGRGDHERRRDGDDRDHEVSARAELEEHGPGDASPAGARATCTFGTRSPVTSSPGRRAVRRLPEHEVRERHDPRASGRRELDRGVERQQVRRPVGRRRGVDDVARTLSPRSGSGDHRSCARPPGARRARAGAACSARSVQVVSAGIATRRRRRRRLASPGAP